MRDYHHASASSTKGCALVLVIIILFYNVVSFLGRRGGAGGGGVRASHDVQGVCWALLSEVADGRLAVCPGQTLRRYVVVVAIHLDGEVRTVNG